MGSAILFRVLRVVSILVLIVVAACGGVILTTHLSTRGSRHSETGALTPTRVAIVFGARVYNNSTLSPMLADRVSGAASLYRSGTVRKLLMSGDNRAVDYNEVTAMQQAAIALGVPESDIVLDYGGRSTYDSCYRARHIFGVREAILVTHAYHAPRAIFTCRALSLRAQSFVQPDFNRYPDKRIPYTVREYLADLKAWWQLYVTRPEAEVMGSTEPAI